MECLGLRSALSGVVPRKLYDLCANILSEDMLVQQKCNSSFLAPGARVMMMCCKVFSLTSCVSAADVFTVCVDACVALVSVDVVEFFCRSDTGNTAGQVGPTQEETASSGSFGSWPCKSKLLDVSRDAVHTTRHVHCLLCAESYGD